MTGLKRKASQDKPEEQTEKKYEKTEEKEDGSDSEVIIVKSNIYNFQGALSLSDQVKEDVLRFEYRNEDNVDDDLIEILSDESEDEENVEEEENIDTVTSCEKCGDLENLKDLPEHMEEKHPTERKVKKFKHGEFFVIAE